MRTATASLILPLLLPALAAAQSPSGYAGEEQRSVKALSEQETRALLEGQGLGFAKAAELNHYPGPRHVLDLAGKLRLDAAQKEAVERSFERMRSEARRLGAEIVALEAALDRQFAEATVTAASLDAAVSELARKQGELRVAHLRAHLETRAVLTAEQVARYDELRGYGAGHGGADSHNQPAHH